MRFSRAEIVSCCSMASFCSLSLSMSHCWAIALSFWILLPVAFSFSSSSDISSSRVIRVPSYFPDIEASFSLTFPRSSSSSRFREDRSVFLSSSLESCFRVASYLASREFFSFLAEARASRSESASLVLASYLDVVTTQPPVPRVNATRGTTIQNSFIRNPFPR